MSYTLHQKISSGGMADLYLATQKSEGFHKAVVIKCLREEHLDRPDFIDMFRTEVKIYASLEHPHIINVIDAIEVFGRQAVVMELIVGADLAAAIKRSEANDVRIPAKVILYICRAIAKGLHYAHTSKHPVTGESLGIIHRDVSPGNILISEMGEIKLADFGIAKARIQNHDTIAGVVKGKFSYMSPEQAYGHALKPTSDLFSLGVILWEALAGRKRFAGFGETEILQRLGPEHPISPLKDIQPEVNEELNEIVMRAVAPFQEDRYVSCAAFAKVLDDYMRKYYPKFSQDQFRAYFKSLMKNEIEELTEFKKQALSGEHQGILVEEQPSAVFSFNDTQPTEPLQPIEPEGGSDSAAFGGNQADPNGNARQAVGPNSRTMALNLSDASTNVRKPIAATPIADMNQAISNVNEQKRDASQTKQRRRAQAARPEKTQDRFLIYSMALIVLLVIALIVIYRVKHR